MLATKLLHNESSEKLSIYLNLNNVSDDEILQEDL